MTHCAPVALALAAALGLCSTSCSKSGSATAADAGGTTASGSAPAASGAGPLAGATLSALTSGFEGEIDGFTQKAGAAQTPISLLLKGDKVRFEVPEDMAKNAGQFLGEKAWAVYDSAGKKLTAVSDAKKQAVVIDLNSGRPVGGFGPGAHGPGAPPSGPPSKIVKTGKYETVAGYKCEDWDVTSDHKEGTLCVAEQGVSWLSLPLSALPSERAYMAELVDGHHFPLRFVSFGKDGATEEQRIEVTKIDKKSLQDAQFQVPQDYKVMDLDKMFAGMGGMPGMPPGMPSGMTMPPGFHMPHPMPQH
jgi:hypothetical protein